VSRRKTHKIRVRRKNLYGLRLWWATCTCGRLLQGCYLKAEAKGLADRHREKTSAGDARG
jgi:hypothetical protein